MSDAEIIEKMISLSKKILSYIQNLEYDEFSKKEMIVEACAFNLGQLGELSHKLSAEFKNNYLNIPWKSIYGMRNERTPTQSVRGIVRSAKELHSGLIPFISPQRGGVLNPRHE
ncbi:MAG: DUF86 domain-containing protein [Spirochaetales bacterium]|nr:DUF86 domain-containing protein [Spirochaetales bacterium]